MKKYCSRDGVDWGTVHAFLANMGGWYLNFGPELGEPTKQKGEAQKTEKNETIEQVRKQTGVKEEPDHVVTSARAATMPNLSSNSAELEAGLQHANTDTVALQSKPSLLRTLSRVAGHIAPPQANNTDGKRTRGVTHRGGPNAEITRYKDYVVPLGEVLWKQNEYLTATVKEVQVRTASVISFRNLWLKRMTIFQTDIWPLDAEQLYLCRDMGLIQKLPDMPEEEVEDQSKADVLVETFAIVQLIWFCVQLIGRAVEKLAITQLEIFVLAFATCSTLTYLLQLQKPKDIMTPRYLSAVRYPTSEEMYTIASRGSIEYGRVLPYHGIAANALHRCVDELGLTPQLAIFNIMALASSTLFGALHLLAWNFHFPTLVELWLWRIASLCITAIPPLAPIIAGAMMVRTRTIFVELQISVVLLFCAIFTLCRVFILVEALGTLAYLEPSAYATTWSVNMPHIG